MESVSLRALLLGALVTLSSQVAQATPPFDLLVEYYKDTTGGLIAPVSMPPAPGAPEEDWFKLDVARFTSSESAPDFLEATRAFYSKLDFDDATQSHEQPYEYLASWRSLFHPPIKSLELPIEQYDRGFGPWFPAQAKSRYFDPDFQRELDVISGTELTFGNQVDLLPNGSSFAEKFRMIRKARKTFFGAVMVFFCDESTKLLADEMIRAKKRGVDVRLVVEGLWASTVAKKCLKPMRKAGIPVELIADFWRPGAIPSVMHHKIWIRDGEEAIIGGQNMHENSNYATGYNRRTRDTDMIFRSGPSVTDLSHEYAKLWIEYTKGERRDSMQPYLAEAEARMAEERRAGMRGADAYAEKPGSPATRSLGACRILVQRSAGRYEQIAPVLWKYLYNARSRVTFTTPSVDYDLKGKKQDRWPQILAATLRDKAAQGVRIDALSNGLEGGSGELAYIIEQIEKSAGSKLIPFLPWILDSIHVWRDTAGARSGRKTLMDIASMPGARAWTYREFTHQKVWTFDRLATSVGSMNFDDFSTEKSHESTAICMDARLVDQVERQLVLDLANSVPVVSRNGVL